MLLHPLSFKIKSMVLVCSIPWLCIVKNGQKWPSSWGRESRLATPTKLFSVDFYDLKSMSIKFGNDIFITFEMPNVLLENQHFVDTYSVHLLQRSEYSKSTWWDPQTRVQYGPRFVTLGASIHLFRKRWSVRYVSSKQRWTKYFPDFEI